MRESEIGCKNCRFSGKVTAENIDEERAFFSGAMELGKADPKTEVDELYNLLALASTDIFSQMSYEGGFGRQDDLWCSHPDRKGMRRMSEGSTCLVILDHDRLGKPVYGFEEK